MPVLLAAVLLGGSLTGQSETLIASNSVWKYLDDGSDQGTSWRGTNFTDTAWPSASAQFGYGDGDETTTVRSNRVSDSTKILTFYFRKTINVTDAGTITNMSMKLLRDDGAVVYVNGTEIVRTNLPNGTITFSTSADSSIGPPVEQTYAPYSTNGNLLVTGNNVIAVEMHQYDTTPPSSDVSFDLEFSVNRSAGNTAPSVSISNPANNTAFTAPASLPLNATATDPEGNGTITKVEFYEGNNKLGEDAGSPYGITWNGVVAGTYQLTARVTDNGGLMATSTIVNVTVTNNAPPTVSLTTPANGASFSGPLNLALAATAADNEGVSKVEFFEGTTKLGEDTSNPYSFAWNGVTAGGYQLKAVATDIHGLTATSSVATITVTNNTPPTVNLTNPTNQQSFAALPSIIIDATASDSDGVAKVEFYEGVNKLGEDTGSPFSFTWNNVPGGSYALTAVATDGAGRAATSAPVNITVVGTVSSTNVLIAFGANWRYLDDGSDQGTVWRNGGYSDAGWSNGPAQLGFSYSPPELDEATTNRNLGTNGQPIITYYYRSYFTLSNAAAYTALNFRLLRDDGGVVYVNGTEIFRSPNMPAGLISYTNLSGSAQDNTVDTGSSSASTLQDGTNIIAVEIHQSSASSSDVSFDFELAGVFNNARPTATITSPTNGQNFTAPVNLTLDATASDGDGVSKVDFYQGSTFLGQDAAAPYSFTVNNVTSGGSYSFRAVAQDVYGARGTSAVVTVTVSGNVPPTVSLTNPPNNAVFNVPAEVALNATATDSDGTITKVEFYAGASKVGEDTGSPYALTWTNTLAGSYALTAVATDNGGLTATSAPVNVTFGTPPPSGTLVATGSVWKYLDDGSDQGVAWREPGYNDSGWSNGVAELGFGDIAQGRPEATLMRRFGTNGQVSITFYFRSTFFVANPALYTSLALRIQRDDGAVVYLNDNEVLRSNMPLPPAVITSATPASGAATDDGATLLQPTNLPSSLLVTGVNLVTVEIHQSDPGSSDVSFDLSLTGSTNNELPTVSLTSPVNNAVFTDPANLTLAATASDNDGTITNVLFLVDGALLAADPTAPHSVSWQNVPVGTYALTAVAQDNLGAARTSSVVTVFVVAATAPTIASFAPPAGAVSSLSQVTVNFTEPLDGVNTADLLINGTPASGVTGGPASYTFTFPQPMDGVVSLTWARGHGIADREIPPQAFSGTETNETAQYTLTDGVAPAIVEITPVPGATLATLTELAVKFSEAVGGVNASDLLLNGQPAESVTGSGDGAYVFSFAQPTNGPAIVVTWTSGHGIRDFAMTPNAFVSNSWSYTLNTNLADTDVVINEIHYQPLHALNTREPVEEEFIELFNRGANPVNLTGWRLTRGVSFTFTNRTLAAGGYLVVAANTAAFAARHPAVTQVIGNWTGSLANSGEDIELENAQGQRVDLVPFADEGEWSLRQRVNFGGSIYGWTWASDADGGGRSLELRNPALPNNYGPNWAASTSNHGTPGAANSVFSPNIAPLIVNAQHSPAVPASTNDIVVTARIVDEQTNGLAVTLFYRNASGSEPLPAFNTAPMLDNGSSSDGTAGDGVFGVSLPPQSDGTILEFYVQAVDAGNRTNTWPAASREPDGVTFTNRANALLMVDNDSGVTSRAPTYRLIMTEPERAMLALIDGANNAEMNTTLIIQDGSGTRVRYNVGVRHRGNSSRGDDPPNYRVNVPSDNRTDGYESFNLNERFPYSQYIGAVSFLKAGATTEIAYPVVVLENGVNRVPSGYPRFNHYVRIEDVGADFVAMHYPYDSDGNAYRVARPGNFGPIATDPASLMTSGYSKQSNQGEWDWSDLGNLITALNSASPNNFAAVARQTVNVDAWIRYFAVMTLSGFGETSIGSNGDGDDYTIYMGKNDPRAILIPHDHDTDFGEGDGSAQPFTVSIFRMLNNPATPPATRFLTNSVFTPLYFAELKRQCETVFRPDAIWKLMDETLLGDWVDGTTRDRMKLWASNRCVYVLSQIPTNLTVTHSLIIVSGYPQTTSPTVALSGMANVIETRAVRVNGQLATWAHMTGAWSTTLALQPGVNHVLVQSVDAAGAEMARTTLSVWYDDGGVADVSGAIGGSQSWTPAGGPYNVTAPLTIGNGATLTIQPGTTVYLAAGAGITVSGTGRLLAEGTESQHIRFTRPPAGAGTWGQIFLNGASSESRIAYADIEYAGSSSGAVRADNSVLYLDHVVFGNTAVQYLNLNNSSFHVRQCVFPSSSGVELIHGSGLPAAGYGILDGNWFGTTTGLNDIIDFTGGQRPNAILQILNNTFTAASDDHLDLDGTDCHIEGNVFMNAHQGTPGDPDTSSAISAGRDGANTAEITIVRNLFYDCDHAALVKEGNFYTLANNTMVKMTISAVNFDEPLRAGIDPGLGADLDGNIILHTPRLFENQTNGFQNVTVNRCILPASWPGTGNLVADPLLTRTNGVTWQTIRSDFRLLAGSPALGTGPNGLDRGALVPAGASISGEPVSPTPVTTATLTVGGPGITHYRFKLDNGGYGSETPVATPITLSGLPGGLHTVSVIGKNDANVWQEATNATFARAWFVKPTLSGLRLNEVLARNTSGGDLIEIYNASGGAVNLGGLSITDNPDDPRKFVFPSTVLASGQHLVLYADSDNSPPGLHLGFTLKGEGDDLFLFDAAGMLLDSVEFGLQLADLSIGRLADGTWALNTPTFGSNNVAARTGDPVALLLNEWLAAGDVATVDFIELYNPGSLPVSLGGLYLTDNPIGAPNRHEVDALSFIAGGGFTVFFADDNAGAGANHLNFNLAAEHGIIALMNRNLSLIDCVFYDRQTNSVSYGRSPNGAATFGYFLAPTPGAPNPGPPLPPGTHVVINEVLANNVTYEQLDGKTPDLLELFNPTASPVDLSDMSLSDASAAQPPVPRKYVFPNGVVIPAFGYLVIRCDSGAPASATNTGFGLKASGGSVYLYDKPANGGSEVDSVTYGLQAVDFSIGRVPSGDNNWVLTTPSFGSANNATSMGSRSALRINEWMNNDSSGSYANDWFEIYNPALAPVALAGLYLTDNLSPANHTKYTIPALSFIGIGLYAYQKFEADNPTPPFDPDHVNFRLSNSGESLGIYAGVNQPIDTYSFGNPGPGISQGRLPDGSNTVVSFPATQSPGDANYLPLTNLVINEVLSHTDPPFDDAIELRNVSGASVNIGGWWLSDQKRSLKKHRIPDGTVIAAGGFKVFYEHQFNPDPNNSSISFSLDSAKGDQVYLSQGVGAGGANVLTGYRATVSFGAASNSVAFGRYTNSVGDVHFVAMSARTFGFDNPETTNEWHSGMGLANAYPRVGPIVFTEIMYHPADLAGGADNTTNEFLELHNPNATDVPLYHPEFPTNRWRLRDGVDFDFAPGTVITAGSYLLVVSFDPVNDPVALAAFRATYNLGVNVPIVGPFSGKLDNGGETVELYMPDRPEGPGDANPGYVPYILVERVKYDDVLPWPALADGTGLSLQRLNNNLYGNDPNNWQADSPTPGPASNPDSDNDGMPDDWEALHGLVVGVNDSGGDPDDDGMTNVEEYQAGTDPQNPLSYLLLTIVGGGPAMLEFLAMADRSYTIEYVDALDGRPWQRFTNVAAGAQRLVQLPAGTSPTVRFFRLRTPVRP